MSEIAIKTPVAFIIFNRPDTTAKVFEEIRKVKPPILLVIADGPRSHRTGEAELVVQTRQIINKVDWPCDVLTNYSEINMGCKNRLTSGIDWIFQQVDEAIILEDDCLPHHSFFSYCEELLAKYRNDDRIGIISGTNLVSSYLPYSRDSYSFSKHCLIWGWATWGNRWKHYSKTLKDINKKEMKQALELFKDDNKSFKHFWENIYTKSKADLLTTWDFQLSITSFYQRWMNIVPNTNLIKNIGYGIESTHTSGSEPKLVQQSRGESIGNQLIHPECMRRNIILDQLIDDYFLPPLYRILASRIKSLILR
jgi:hypothetical protein